MKHLYSILFLLLGAVYGYGQNLVPNPSFEDTVTCPETQAEVFKAKYWNSYKHTPDYFNSCSPNKFLGHSNIGVSVPSNFLGHQMASSGNAYCGLAEQSPEISAKIIREFIGTPLTNPLVIGEKYYVEFKVSLADSSLYACNKLGVQFTTSSHIDSLQDGGLEILPFNNQAKIYANYIISDTTNWVTISGSFISDSAYKYIVIGNFFEDSLTNCISTGNSVDHMAYYYIDDICVSSDSSTCLVTGDGIQLITGNKLTFYPNPAHDMVYLQGPGRYQYAITNLLGQPVTAGEASGTNSINVSPLPRGVYLLQVFSHGTLLERKRLVLN